MSGFRTLDVSDWRQFGSVNINFHPRLTILTGANASGKSTILGILARHLNWSRVYSSSPDRRSRRAGGWHNLGPRRMRRFLESGGSWDDIGRLYYENGTSTVINVPIHEGLERSAYDLDMPNQQHVSGVYLSSHRTYSERYVNVPTIPTAFMGSGQILEDFTGQLHAQWSGQFTGRSSQLALKESLLAAAMFGASGNDSVDGNEEATAVWFGFQDILRNVIPSSIGFNRLRVRMPDLILETETGDFILDEASGGISAIVEIAWQLFLKSRQTPVFTALLDEPENHLHPSLQREVLPSLLFAFPDAQFIVATHSPFVVTATPNSSVYALEYNESKLVVSRWLDYATKSATADEILKRVLGLPSTYPVWAEDRFAQILERHLHGSLSAEAIASLRRELENAGLESVFPEATLALLDGEQRGLAE
ncbi:AAA family ATPase [Plantibacter sp. VKM Ac-2885]|nr:AAA family ATPase [Plantibacter sp. VKM Ac-2885]